MPKAKPLPEDPKAREKVLKLRRQLVKDQQAWRKRNPDAARIYGVASMQRHRASQKARKRLQYLRTAA